MQQCWGLGAQRGLTRNHKSKYDMRTVTIKTISLKNWRGQTRSVDLDSKSAVISGTNHSGKSSVMNAFLWLVLGTDNMDRSNYLLFDNTIEQTHDNAVPAEVEAEIVIDGNPMSIKRVATQGWVRRRGSDVYERSGSDNYAFFVDGIERSATQYKADMEEFFGAPTERLKIILNLNYFLGLKWDVQRKHLGDIIGEVTIEDLGDKYAEIFDALKRYSIEDLKQKYKSQLKPAKEQLEKLPVAIETLENNLVSLDGVEEAKANIQKLKDEIALVDIQIADKAKAVEVFANKRMEELKTIARKEEALFNDGVNYRREKNDNPELVAIIGKIGRIEKANANIEAQKLKDLMEIKSIDNRISSLTKQCMAYSDKDKQLKEEIKEVKAREFTDDKCPFCGQELPSDKLAEAKKRFNEKKNADRENIKAVGASNKELWRDALDQIEGLKKQKESLVSKTYEPESTETLEKQKKAILDSIPDFEQTVQYAAAADEITALKANLTVVPAPDDRELKEKKAELQQTIVSESEKLGVTRIRENQLVAIQQHKDELKAASVEAAKLEGTLNLITKFERDKAEVIRQRVNRLFKYCDVQMETLDKSGLPVATCIINDKGGVDARVTNTASSYNCRIDIASAFARFYGVNLPLFVDNAEAVNDFCLLETDCQTIELKVSEKPFTVKTR